MFLRVLLGSALALAALNPVELNDQSTFNEVRKSANGLVVKFYSPKCSHCLMMAPTWDAIRTEFTSSTVTIADVDCTSVGGRSVCDNFGVHHYPAIKYFKTGGEISDFDSDRDPLFVSLRTFIKESGTSGTPALNKKKEPKKNNIGTLSP